MVFPSYDVGEQVLVQLSKCRNVYHMAEARVIEHRLQSGGYLVRLGTGEKMGVSYSEMSRMKIS